MMSTSNTISPVSLGSLSPDLIIYISDYCDLNGMESLSFTCRSINELIRIRPLDPPFEDKSSSEQNVLRSEASVILKRLNEWIENKSFNSANNETTDRTTLQSHHQKLFDAFISRYAKYWQLRIAQRLVEHETRGSDSSYWKAHRILDTIVLHKDAPYFLYYWDNRHGNNWEGWWITPHSIGFTRYTGFSREKKQKPYQCREWNSTALIVRKEPFGDGVLVIDTSTQWKEMQPWEGFYKQIESPHNHGNRPVYRRMRAFLLHEKS